MAAEAIEATRRRGLRVPEDVAFIGYSDLELARYLHLTSVRQDPKGLGRRAAERLIERIAAPDIPPARITLPTSLTVRHSSRMTPEPGTGRWPPPPAASNGGGGS
jgi:DNA-binding LacI/PurR family transcriptional regulator